MASDDAFDRLVGTLVAKLAIADPAAADCEGFNVGPLPLPWGAPPVSTDAERRSSYLAFRASSVLYGVPHRASQGPPTTSREYRFLEPPQGYDVPDRGTVEVTAVEILRLEGGTPENKFDTAAFGIFHVRVLGADKIGALNEWFASWSSVSGVPQVAHAASELFGPRWVVASSRGREVSVMLATREAGVSSSSRSGLSPWTELDLAMYLAASLGPLDTNTPDPESPDLTSDVVHLSASWRALALRDGLGFVALSPDDGSDPHIDGRAETLVRSVYTDVALLAHLQYVELGALADHLSAAFARHDQAARLKELTNQATAIRNQLWWDDVSASGVANKLLRACQNQLGTHRLFDRVMDDLASFRHEVDSEQIQATAEAQARFDRVVKRAGAALAGASLVLAILGVNLTGLTTGNGIQVGAAIGMASIVAALSFLGVWYVTRDDIDDDEGAASSRASRQGGP